MTFIQKLARADMLRKSRFHDEKGNLVDLAGWIYLPLAYRSAALKFFGYRPGVPWISYRARKLIDQMIRPDWRMVEFGSGMSTLWFAKRCGFIHSIESDPAWYDLVSRQLAGMSNVRYEKRTIESYVNLDDYPDQSLDFSLIDGAVRSACARSVVPKIKPGGFVYFDNSDKDMTIPNGDTRLAQETLVKAARERGGAIRCFVDFVPCNGVPVEGMLVKL
jgi:predicted O-methyltransferase YrrM